VTYTQEINKTHKNKLELANLICQQQDRHKTTQAVPYNQTQSKITNISNDKELA
jgi:hypothetical protein